MAENSGIAWTTNTWNPWIGCLAVSPACDHCYARSFVNGRMGGDFDQRRRTGVQNWNLPLRWDRLAAGDGRRPRVFTCSLADFWDNKVPPEWRADALDVIRRTPNLDWLILTKRPQNIVKMLAEAAHIAVETRRIELARWLEHWITGDPPLHVWLGVTVENQAEADRRIPVLLRVPAALRYLSMEPLLEHVDLSGWLPREDGCESCDDGDGFASPRCSRSDIPRAEQCPNNRAVFRDEVGPIGPDGAPRWIVPHRVTVDWVIAGGESGARDKVRPYSAAWARALRDQCAAAGVAFFHKQAGSLRDGFPGVTGKGDDPMQWPEDLRIQETPASPAAQAHQAAA